MQVELIKAPARLAEIEPEWWNLYRHSGTTPFQSPAWLLSWYECFGHGSDLHSVALRDGDRLLALLPLFVFDYQGGRWAAPLGAGITDYLDVLMLPEARASAIEALVPVLREVATHVDRLEISDIPHASAFREIGNQLGAAITEHAVCPGLEIDRPIEEQIKALPRDLRRSLKSGANRLERSGDCEWVLATTESVQELMQSLFDLHAARWQERGEPGVFADPSVQRFHLLAAPRLLERALLRLWALRVSGKVAAVVYALHGRECYFYASGFDPGFSDASPGSLTILHVLRDAALQGKTGCDFLRGGEDYKYRWGARDRSTYRFALEFGALV